MLDIGDITFPLENYSGGVFSGKAHVTIDFKRDEICLISYNTKVCVIKPNKFFDGKLDILYKNPCSATTRKHLSAFLDKYYDYYVMLGKAVPEFKEFMKRTW